MADYYDIHGNPLSLYEWAALFEFGLGYRYVDQTLLEDGTKISTIWLGLNHQFDPDGPLEIFESMVWDGQGEETDCERYATYEEAKHGHATLVARESERLMERTKGEAGNHGHACNEP